MASQETESEGETLKPERVQRKPADPETLKPERVQISLVLDWSNDPSAVPQILAFFDDMETARAEAEREWRERALEPETHRLLLLSTRQVGSALGVYIGRWE